MSSSSGEPGHTPETPSLYGIVGEISAHPSISFTGLPRDPTDGEFKYYTSVQDRYKPEVTKQGIRIPDNAVAQAKSHDGYASFGGCGATATVNAYGNIIQLSRFSELDQSGFFCADRSDMELPWYIVDRMRQLTDMSKRPDGGIGLQLGNAEEWHFRKVKPSVEFVHDIWPRFTFQNSNVSKVSLQYFCDDPDGTIFQRYTFKCKNKSPSVPIPSGLKIDAGIIIRNLDYARSFWYDGFNETAERYSIHRTEAHDHSLVIMREISPRSPNFQETKEPETRNSENGNPRTEQAHTAVCLVITAFANGATQKIKSTTESDNKEYEIELDEQCCKAYQSSGRLEITVAYLLQTSKPTRNWKHSLVSTSKLANMAAQFSAPEHDVSVPLLFSPHQHLNFVIRRNLQNILSACSVPVSGSRKDPKRGVVPIALTCGDLSGHRICPAASLFAFQFLAELFRYLQLNYTSPQKLSDNAKDCSCKDAQSSPCPFCKKVQNEVVRLCKRIQSICLGHLAWISSMPDLDDGPFSPHYWATGKPISGWRDDPWLPPKTLTDTPFQIIKVHTFKKFMVDNCKRKTSTELETRSIDKSNEFIDKMTSESNESQKVLDELLEKMSKRIYSWVRELDDADKRGTHTFPRPTTPDNDREKRFHLADHIWIYEALKAVEALGLENHLMLSDSERGRVPDADDSGVIDGAHFSSSEFRKNTRKRFTTENLETKQKMLATSRTSSKTRFLFHSKDTVFLYSDSEFFDQRVEGSKENAERSKKKDDTWRRKVDTWKNTMNCQKGHEENQSLDWEKPLRYALALMIGSKQQRINHLPPDDLMRNMTKTLFGMSSPSGLFPGRIDENNDPLPFDDEFERDNYWRTTFEIPYILWTFGKQNLEESLQEESQENTRERPEVRGSPKQQPSEAAAGTSGQVSGGTGPGKLMMKRMDFNDFKSSIDQKAIVDLKDDWLLPGPDSLGFGFEHDKLEYGDHESTDAHIVEISDNEIDESRTVITKAMRSYRGSFSEPNCPKGSVIDIPKGPLGREINLSEVTLQLGTNPVLLKALAKNRTVHEARKRIIWCHDGDAETALICYFASPPDERENLSAFFDRHASYGKYFLDSTSAASNEWETELHISFFRKESLESKQGGIPSPTFITLQEPLQNDTATGITRAIMSFRFVGDFFDRYWTCHFLEHKCLEVVKGTKKHRLLKLGDIQPKDKGKARPWQQRKVLELLLFEIILEEMMFHTEELLDWVQDQVLLSPELRKAKSQQDGKQDKTLAPEDSSNTLFEQPFNVQTYNSEDNPLAKLLQRDSQFLVQGSSESYFAINERWRIMEQILQAVEDDLSENVERIHDWMRREKDRESEKPRWTRSDEKKYRSSITKLQVLNQRKAREIERLQARIRVFRESLSGRLSSIRDDISFRGSENINLFTYVTVVFLPLGFATGVFSMNGVPERNTLISMMITSVAAVFITIVALTNAKSLDYKAIELVTGPIVKTLRRVGNLLLYFVLPVLYLLLLIVSPFLLVAYAVVYFFHRYVVMPISEPRLDFIISVRDWYVRLVQHHDPVNDAKFEYRQKHSKEKPESPEKNAAVSSGAQGQEDGLDVALSPRRRKTTDIESGEHMPDAQ